MALLEWKTELELGELTMDATHREYAENTFNLRGGCGFSFGNGCSEGTGETSLFGSEKKRTIPIKLEV